MRLSDYHKAEGLSKSGLDLINRSPLHYETSKETPKEPTPQMIFGSAYHCLVLEPDEYEKQYVIAPEINRRTNAGKGEWAKWVEDNADKTVIAKEDQGVLNDMAKVLWAHPLVQQILKGAIVEQSIFAEMDSVKVKCRPDIMCPSISALFDLKTAVDASWTGFSKACGNSRYDVQAAWYLDVLNLATEGWYEAPFTDFGFVVQEKTKPYAVAVYVADEEMVEIGREKYKVDLLTFEECLATGNWPGYPTAIQRISLPRWAK